jgi:serine/threonine-protein kinase
VALKFLPETLAMSPGALARFHAEARIARQVSHPNVCRVHDVGDVDGLQFLTMELIDGEDLASLLRRIGRLPADKAVEIARELCVGLAAAHDAGVLHRDLKPHNVMIDGRGRARITDFGIAAIARDVRQDHVIASTPGYMSPEQVRGRQLTVRSDVYALGLILYELFTGKRAIQASSLADAERHHSSGSVVTTPSDLVRDLDPNVERVILRCLERDPAARPASAIQVAAVLPGGDPLRAALAAGETPSPEMVAAAGSHNVMRPAAALGLAAATIAVTVIVAVVTSQFTLLRRVAADVSPDVLSFRARETLAALGYPDRGRDHAVGFERNLDYLDWDRVNRPTAGRMDRLAIPRPAALSFWYRESLEPLLVLVGMDKTGPPIVPPVSLVNPPSSDRGMRHVRLDMKGRLVEFGAIPLATDGTAHPAQGMDWNPVFSAAGLDRQAFQPATPSWTPAVASDEQAA